MNIPESIFHKIMLFNSHPVADMFKQKCKCLIEDAMEGEEEDENFYFQWIDAKEQNRYNFGTIKDDTNYCNYCNEWVRRCSAGGCMQCREPP
jgi:hypothetical protein